MQAVGWATHSSQASALTCNQNQSLLSFPSLKILIQLYFYVYNRKDVTERIYNCEKRNRNIHLSILAVFDNFIFYHNLFCLKFCY